MVTFVTNDRRRLTPKEEFPHFGVVQQFVASACDRNFPGYKYITNVRKFQAFLGILLHHNDGLAFGILQVI